MKKLLLLGIGIFISILLFAKPLNDNWTNKNTNIYDSLLHLISADLGLDTTDIRIRICDIYFNKELNYGGYDAGVKQIDKELYLISIDNSLVKSNLILSYIHEMVHVKQMAEKRLVIKKQYVWYQGTVITNDVPYREREYEIEAHKLSEDLYRKYQSHFRNLKIER